MCFLSENFVSSKIVLIFASLKEEQHFRLQQRAIFHNGDLV